MKLENWSVVYRGNDPYTAPELRKQSLHGKVFGHPRFDDGEDVTTSSIVAKDQEFVCTSSGSKYELGDVDKEYEAIYPNARERLFASLDEVQP